jgi:hypothetical protein
VANRSPITIGTSGIAQVIVCGGEAITAQRERRPAGPTRTCGRAHSPRSCPKPIACRDSSAHRPAPGVAGNPPVRAEGYAWSARHRRRAIAEAKAAWRTSRRVYRPWLPVPGEHVVMVLTRLNAVAA